MRDFIKFALLFVSSYVLLQFAYEFWLTLTYEPNVYELWKNESSSNKHLFAGMTISRKPLLGAVFVTAIAYFVWSRYKKVN
ncbi:hypothetical protein [Bacillus solimangrovi]|uniref:Uncharacterized protein n=1 Tax=Bacillus solimangrovi TaxID=1305675 RepID=A0A1E5LD50_9BACI|nr:hypothetical protein [Bacillus solimangrovi]OEH92001.1 hypothetical protein BFG57_17200 [Bacillus solimangrovi]